MQRQHVGSSVFKSVGYDEGHEILELEFKETGDVWHYLSFSTSDFEKFIQSGSLGHFFSTRIRNKYEEMKVH